MLSFQPEGKPQDGDARWAAVWWKRERDFSVGTAEPHENSPVLEPVRLHCLGVFSAGRSSDVQRPSQRGVLRRSPEMCSWLHRALDLTPLFGLETHPSVLLNAPPTLLPGGSLRERNRQALALEGTILVRTLGIFCFRAKLTLL